MHINFLTFPWKFCACAVLLGAMSSVASLRRPSAADVRPGTELYDTIIRALRGEYQWKKASDPSSVEKRRALPKQSRNTIANVSEEIFLNVNCLENLPSIETPPSTPPIKRHCHVHNADQTATVATYEQGLEAIAAEDVFAISSTTSTSTNDSTITNMELPGEQNLSVANPLSPADMIWPTPVSLEHSAQTVQPSTVAQKVQRISQIDKAHSKPQPKYKPPYKIERSSKPSEVLHLAN